MFRTHNCNELRSDDVEKKVTLCGWVSARRDHGEIIFMDLRDKRGITQIVFDPEKNRKTHEIAHELRDEYCVQIKGVVKRRPEGTVNPKIQTGEIEVDVEEIEVLSRSATPPFEIKDETAVSEDVRLKYRYLDLRRPLMQEKLLIRHKIFKYIFNFLDSQGFLCVETPILTKSTPEGARDFLVPSRLQPGAFYALPQSPQLFKQLLMVAGVEKYFQIAKCFRDEDLRADRQLEFTQLDMEMSFISQEDLFGVCELLFQGLFKEIMKRDVETPFPRMTHEEAMTRYGTDKPDTRFGVLLNDLTEDVRNSDFRIFKEVIGAGGRVIGLSAPGYGNMSRKEIDDLTLFVSEYGAKGLAYFKVEEKGLVSPIAKFFQADVLGRIREKTGARTGDMVFIIADAKDVAYAAMSALRLKVGREKELFDKSAFQFLWVTDFPLFKYNKDEKKWDSEHHPFTSFAEEDMAHLEKGDLARIRSRAYDLVLNGWEIGSGSIRIHKRDIQEKIFEVLGIAKEDAKRKFGFLLEAFQYGPPPHGGVAFGIDRVMTLFTGDASIREVIPFPKTQKGICPLTEAPSFVEDIQLRELGIKLRK